MLRKTALKIFQFSLFLILLPSITFSQSDRYSSSSKAAIKSYEKGVQAFNARQNDEALRNLRQAASKDSNFVEAYILMATIYEEQNQNSEAIEQYVHSFSVKPDFFPNNYSRCGNLELKIGLYNDALSHFNKYLSYPGIKAEKKKQVERSASNCRFAIEAKKHPVPFDPKNLGESVNTKDGEYYFSFTVDQQTLIFTRDIQDKQSMYGHQEDFFMSKWLNNQWSPSIHLPAPLNSTENEGAPSISADGHALFFTACNKEDGKGSCDLYLSQLKPDLNWTKPINLGSPINTGLFESQPSFSSDGKTLYFTRSVKAATQKDHTDIYYSVFQSDMTWSVPKSISDKINTSGNEESVFIHPDNQTIYFSSDGLPGMGGLDIYMARKQQDGSWGDPVNLGYPINTFNDENSFVVSADGLRAYFASDRPGGFGKLDIYVFDLYKEARPLLTSFVRGKVTDATTKMPLSANFEIIDVATGNVVMSSSTEKTSGEFLACLPAGKTYMLNVNKESYLFHSESFECKNVVDIQQAYSLNIALKKPAVGETVVLKNIFFDVNKYGLKSESYAELGKLIQFLNLNPAIKIEIGGHTDNTGDKKNNQLLSENRAKAVYDYLIGKGIVAIRVSYKGYGDIVPVASNDTEEGRGQNRRTDVKIKSM